MSRGRPTRRSFAFATALLAVQLALLSTGCGGSSSPAAPPVAAPTGLTYTTNPASYLIGMPIPANRPLHGGGPVTAFAITPALPDGLALDAVTGQITGAALVLSPSQVYRVRASGPGGEASVDLAIAVQDRAPFIQFATATFLYWKGASILPVEPISLGGGQVVSWEMAPPPPPGLSFSATTGILTGTPTAGAAQQRYTVTATNSGGTATADLTIAVAGAAPIIATFTPTPSVVEQGSAALLEWTLAGDPADSVTFEGFGVLGSTSRSVWPRRRQAYTLEASNRLGSSVATVTVAARGLELLAGNLDGPGWRDGVAEARFNRPYDVAVDSASNIYVVDFWNHTIRKIAPGGVVTTLAGQPGQIGAEDGTGSSASFRNPAGVAIDPAGNLYVTDRGNNTIRKVTPAGVVTTLAGQAYNPGSADGTGSAARFNGPTGITWTPAGDLVVVDYISHTLRRVTTAGVVTTLAGSAGDPGTSDGTGSAARFKYPWGVVAHSDGYFYVADSLNQTIRKVSSAGQVTTLAGSATLSGWADGTGAAARFSNPRYLAVDGAGDLWVTDLSHRVRKVTTAGVVTSPVGVNGGGTANGSFATAGFRGPQGLAFLSSGLLVVADEGNSSVRVIDFARSEVATVSGTPPQPGSVDGLGDLARFDAPYALVLDEAGEAFVVDFTSGALRKVTPAGSVSTFLPAGTFAGPTGLARDAAGNLYVACQNSHVIQVVTPAGAVSVFAGTLDVSGSADGTGTGASFFSPAQLAFDRDGNLYVTDVGNQTIRLITPARVVSTLAGSPGLSGLVDGQGSAARFNLPYGIAADRLGNVIVGDLNNNRLRKISPAGVVTTLLTDAFLYGPGAMAFDAAGTLWVADLWNHAVLSVVVADPPATSVTTLRIGTPGLVGAFTGRFPAGLSYPSGLAITPAGDLLLSTVNGLVIATAP